MTPNTAARPEELEEILHVYRHDSTGIVEGGDDPKSVLEHLRKCDAQALTALRQREEKLVAVAEDKIIELCEAPSCARCHGARVPVRSVSGVVTAYCPRCDNSRVSLNQREAQFTPVRPKKATTALDEFIKKNDVDVTGIGMTYAQYIVLELAQAVKTDMDELIYPIKQVKKDRKS